MFNGGYLTRDKNSCINMMNIVKSLIYTNQRALEYKRPERKNKSNSLLKKESVSSTLNIIGTNAVSASSADIC